LPKSAWPSLAPAPAGGVVAASDRAHHPPHAPQLSGCSRPGSQSHPREAHCPPSRGMWLRSTTSLERPLPHPRDGTGVCITTSGTFGESGRDALRGRRPDPYRVCRRAPVPGELAAEWGELALKTLATVPPMPLGSRRAFFQARTGACPTLRRGCGRWSPAASGQQSARVLSASSPHSAASLARNRCAPTYAVWIGRRPRRGVTPAFPKSPASRDTAPVAITRVR